MYTLLASLVIFSLGLPLIIKSPAFLDNGYIPTQYTCHGANINPELSIVDIPEKTITLALIMDDPDAPDGSFDHWLMWNIPVIDKIEENSALGIQGKNGNLENKYAGPCPPSGIHHYHFKIYALDKKLDLPPDADKTKLLMAMDGHIITSGELTGLYEK